MRRAPLRNERRRQVDAVAQRKVGHCQTLLLPSAARVGRVRGVYMIEQPQHGSYIYSLDELDKEDLEKDGF